MHDFCLCQCSDGPNDVPKFFLVTSGGQKFFRNQEKVWYFRLALY